MRRQKWVRGAGLWLAVLLGAATVVRGEVRLEPWRPLFAGVELAAGDLQTSPVIMNRGVALRIALKTPGLRFFSTPHSGPSETLGQTASEFLVEHKLQAAINGSFYEPVADKSVPINIIGMSISEGKIVSPPSSGCPALCLTRENQARFVVETPATYPTAGIHTAISGGRMIVVGGKNVGAAFGNSRHPRTAVGLTQDRETLFWLVIDGRQPGYSLGTTDQETAEWLLKLGAFDGLMLDGGGSTAMVYADPQGKPLLANRPIHQGRTGRERYNGNHLGLYAPPLANRK